MSFGPRLPAQALIQQEPQRLIAGPLAPCAGCGELTAIRTGETKTPDAEVRCSFCHQGRDPMAPLRDTAGLLADLSEHMPDKSAHKRDH